VLWTTASAQKTLTLDQCLSLARSQSPALRASENSVRLGTLAEAELSASRLPQIKGVAGTTYAPVPPPFGYDPAISNGGQLNAQIAVQQPLYDGGVRRLKSDQLHMASETLAMEHRRTQRDIVFSVRESFIEALRFQVEVELHRTSITLLQQYLDLVQRLYKGGSGSYTDVLKTELQLLQEDALLKKADESMALSKLSLSELMQMDLDTSVTLAGSLETLIASDSSSLREADSSLVSARSLELEIARVGIEQSLIDVELAKLERSPVVTLMGDGGYLSSLENLRLPADMRLSSFGFSVGIGLELPLFNGGATDLRIEQKQVASENLRFQLEVERRSHIAELKKIRLQLFNAYNRLRSIRAGSAKAEENFLLTKSKYAGGAALSLEVLSAQQLMTDSKLNELETLADIQHLHARLEQLSAQ
jgi:outer membrane protein